MEKRTAHYDLDAVKAVVMSIRLAAFTSTARQGARRMGLNESETLSVVMGLGRSMFSKA